jgi:hypothetical protein
MEVGWDWGWGGERGLKRREKEEELTIGDLGIWSKEEGIEKNGDLKKRRRRAFMSAYEALGLGFALIQRRINGSKGNQLKQSLAN